MGVGTVIFFILFVFLIFLFTLFIIARFKKEKEIFFQPYIDVVVPVYNEGKSMKECLDSIFNSNYPKEKMRVTIVDDGSTDNSVEIASSYDLNIIKQNHLGKVEALNNGVKNSKSEFIVTIDADTILDPNFFTEMIKPFYRHDVGATSGAVKVKNRHTLMGMFQNIEYHNNNLIRNSFSQVFNSGIWFFGSLAAYRKSVIEEIGYFKKDTICEDMDVALEIKKAGYKTINVPKAEGYTIVPETFKQYLSQRKRWWIGGLQSLNKNRSMFIKHDLSTKFLFVNQFWWSFYAFISLPIIIYQVNFWMPSGNFLEVFFYLFRWFTYIGPFYVLYKIPQWGVNYYNIFGVLSGIISLVMVLSAIKIFNDKITFKNLIAIFFYFPYTIFSNLIVCISMLTHNPKKPKHFIK